MARVSEIARFVATAWRETTALGEGVRGWLRKLFDVAYTTAESPFGDLLLASTPYRSRRSLRRALS